MRALARAWRRLRRPLIATAVLLHFVVGVLCFAAPPSALLEVAAVDAAVRTYDRLGLAQTWRMFAPPARAVYTIGYALRFDDGWSDLLALDDIAADRARGRFILPRGQVRLGNQLRHPNLIKPSLDDEPYYRHLFQQFAAFYCRGAGAVPGLRAIRFYSRITPIEPFFPDDPAAPAVRDPVIRPIYHRECDD